MENHDDPTAGQTGAPGARASERTKQAAEEQLERAKTAGKEQLEAGKERAADRAEQVANAVDSASYELHRQGQQTLAAYAGDFAQRLSSFADRLRTGSVDELASEAQALARRNPGLFVLGSIGLGVVLGRFLKASSRRSHEDEVNAGSEGLRMEGEHHGQYGEEYAEEYAEEYGAEYSASSPAEDDAAGSPADPQDAAASSPDYSPPDAASPSSASPGQSERERDAGYVDRPTGGL